jgi:hypothetical protein
MPALVIVIYAGAVCPGFDMSPPRLKVDSQVREKGKLIIGDHLAFDYYGQGA